MPFASLHPQISKAVQVCGYTTPTPIQAKSIPEILLRKDVVACSHTGSGKTAAFVLPALHQLASQKPTKKTKILILTPTRELADQITKAAGQYGKFLKFNIVSLVGGMPYHHQIRDLQRGADIIVATPGRLMDHMEQGRVDLSNIEMLVLDEADRMLDMGFIEDVEYIAKLTPSNRQTLLFSATVDKKLGNIVRQLLKNPVRIDLSSEKIASPQITQELYRVANIHQKTRLLKHLLNDSNIFKAIIFSATKIHADKLAAQLRDDGFEAAALHGDLRQNVRNRTIDSLRRGKIQFLVATDVAARGIDISDVTHVFNFDMPKFCEDYVHRIGRTGRAGKTGNAISFVMPTDNKHLQRIEKYIGQRIKHVSNINVPEDVFSSAPAADKFIPKDNRDRHERVAHNDSHRPFKARSNENRSEGNSFKKRSANNDNRHEGKSFSKDKPFKKRSANNDNRHEGKSFSEDKPFKKRSTNNDNRHEGKSFYEDKPFKKRSTNNDNRHEGKSFHEDKPFKKRSVNNESRDENKSFSENKPFKKRSITNDRQTEGGDKKPFKKRFTNGDKRNDARKDGDGFKPFKKKPVNKDQVFAKIRKDKAKKNSG